MKNNHLWKGGTIAEGTGIALVPVHRYLLSLKESGELEYNGRKSISTKRIDLESRHSSAPVLGYVCCGEGEEVIEHTCTNSLKFAMQTWAICAVIETILTE